MWIACATRVCPHVFFKTHSERRFAPTTVRQPRNGVRYGLEQVSDIIGIRSLLQQTDLV